MIPINPDSLTPPTGYSHGIKCQGHLLFVAGQVGYARDGKVVSDDLVEQFAQALDNVLVVVKAAGGRADSIGRLTLYVTSKAEYVRCRKPIGDAYRQRMGKHFPAMTLVQVVALVEDRAKVEIEATAVVPATGAVIESR